MAQNLTDVDWNTIPIPPDDGAADHLVGMTLPDICLGATNGAAIRLSILNGLTVIYAYPMTGRPDRALPDGWDQIPGARGCTPQSCAFRDHASDLSKLGVHTIYGLSTQPSDYQREVKERLHLPFDMLSDANLELANFLNLPRMDVDGQILLRRLTMIVENGRIEKVFYPVFPPDRNAHDVMDYLCDRRK